MKKSLELNIDGVTIKSRTCKKSDHDFIFKIVEATIFPLVKKYFKPDQQVFEERFAKDYKERRILFTQKEKIGFYQLSPKKDILYITGIFLCKKYQRKGIGIYVMKYFETLGFKTIRLSIRDNNPAIGFYKKLGYTMIGKKNHKYILEKKIKDIYILANNKDLTDCINLSKKSWPNWREHNGILGKKHIEDCIQGKRCLIVKRDNNIVGFIVRGLLRNKIHIQDIFVEKKYRKDGIATKLMKEVIKMAQRQGFKEIMSDTDRSNLGAIKFHLKCGFKKCGNIEKNRDDEDSYVFSMNIRKRMSGST